MDIHRKQGLSIAYYSGADNTRLGGADYSVPANPGILRLCVSGKTGDGTSFQTLCQNVVTDNDITGASGTPWCMLALGQDAVEDGCYTPAGAIANSLTLERVVQRPVSPTPTAQLQAVLRRPKQSAAPERHKLRLRVVPQL